MNKLTPNLIVESIEDCLPFWMDRLGFAKTVEVADGSRLGFVILRRDEVEIMLQTRASLAGDVAAIADGPYRAIVYIDVAAGTLASIRKALADWPLATPERTTAYGAREIIVRDPAGHIAFFAAHEAAR